eukprot:jgi/Chlat1/4970/Chrsp32S04927
MRRPTAGSPSSSPPVLATCLKITVLAILASALALTAGYQWSSLLRNRFAGDVISNKVMAQRKLNPRSNVPFPPCMDPTIPVSGCPEQATNCQADGAVYALGQSGPFASLLPLFEEQPGRQTHASNLLVIDAQGTLLACWFSGVEGSDDVSIVVSRLEPGMEHVDQKWSAPVSASHAPGRSAQNPVMWLDEMEGESGRRRVHLLHTSQLAWQGQGTSDVRHVVSSDGGLTWSEPQIVFTEKGAFTKNQLVWSDDGELLLPMYYTPGGYEDYASHYCVLKQWVLTAGDMLAQPSVVKPSPGTSDTVLVSFFRSRRSDFIYRSTSTDKGRTWTKAEKTVLPNNNSGIQALRLLSGALVMIFNNARNARKPASIALSYDDGITWPHVRDLEDGIYGGEFSYPSVVQTEDGYIHVSYTYKRETIKYVRVSEQWVREGTGRTVGLHKGGIAQLPSDQRRSNKMVVGRDVSTVRRIRYPQDAADGERDSHIEAARRRVMLRNGAHARNRNALVGRW